MNEWMNSIMPIVTHNSILHKSRSHCTEQQLMRHWFYKWTQANPNFSTCKIATAQFWLPNYANFYTCLLGMRANALFSKLRKRAKWIFYYMHCEITQEWKVQFLTCTWNYTSVNNEILTTSNLNVNLRKCENQIFTHAYHENLLHA